MASLAYYYYNYKDKHMRYLTLTLLLAGCGMDASTNRTQVVEDPNTKLQLELVKQDLQYCLRDRADLINALEENQSKVTVIAAKEPALFGNYCSRQVIRLETGLYLINNNTLTKLQSLVPARVSTTCSVMAINQNLVIEQD